MKSLLILRSARMASARPISNCIGKRTRFPACAVPQFKPASHGECHHVSLDSGEIPKDGWQQHSAVSIDGQGLVCRYDCPQEIGAAWREWIDVSSARFDAVPILFEGEKRQPASVPIIPHGNQAVDAVCRKGMPQLDGQRQAPLGIQREAGVEGLVEHDGPVGGVDAGNCATEGGNLHGSTVIHFHPFFNQSDPR